MFIGFYDLFTNNPMAILLGGGFGLLILLIVLIEGSTID